MKFTVCDANGNPISDPYAVFAQVTGGSLSMLSAVRGTIENVNEVTVHRYSGCPFRYSNGIWILNMATSNLTKNMTYMFRINLANGCYIMFSVDTK